jgi:hypothetical protein
MPFKISDRLLRRLAQINCFPVPKTGMVFFGLRGCLPINPDDHRFAREHQLAVDNVDYRFPRCTLGQWLPEEGQVAVFPGSTVPHQKYVEQALSAGGRGANQLMTGYYTDYRKGWHKAGTSTAHEAFRQTKGRPIRRTLTNLTFDENDPAELENPFDNLHAAWSMSVAHPKFDSAGCQVVLGFPRCARLNNAPDAGPWKAFKDSAYHQPQDRFGYMLLEGRSAQSVQAQGAAKQVMRLRFGSQGPVVAKLQARLKQAGFYEGAVDEDFGERTIRAVLAFQTARFGPDSDDGVVGPTTAGALGLALPSA